MKNTFKSRSVKDRNRKEQMNIGQATGSNKCKNNRTEKKRINE